jgi:hypothetical protein
MTEVTDELSKRIDKEVRQLIGDLQMQIIVLRTALDMMQPVPKQAQPEQPVREPEPVPPEPKKQEEPEPAPEPLHAKDMNGGRRHNIRG